MRSNNPRFVVALLSSLALFLPFVASSSLADTGTASIEQRYVTRWNAEPIVRFAMDERLVINATRCRIDEGPLAGTWIDGRTTGDVLSKTTWRIPVDSLSPGTYSVTHDLRTPIGAKWIPGSLRVPQIARHTGAIGSGLVAPELWPAERYGKIACDSGPVEFAWDRDNLYIRARESSASAIEIDTLPCAAGKHVSKIAVSGIAALPWSKLFPAAPMTGQTLSYRIEGAGDWTDVLFVGSGDRQFFGATIVSDGPGHDDQGPPRPILKALMDMAGFDLSGLHVTWEEAEPNNPGDGPHAYDWSRLTTNPDLYKGGLVLVNVNLQNSWAQPIRSSDPERYWRMAESFVSEAAKTCAAAGVRHFTLGYNEPEMFARSDNKDFFNIHLTHCANAARRAVPDAVVVAGRFSSGDPNLIREFHAHGFKDNFDVLDLHTYTRDPLLGTAMGEIVACHEALEQLGMGHKRIFLGEGWGPARTLGLVERDKWDAPVSPEEADFTRQYYQNGYRCMVSARADYSPNWVLGAKYFTLNDNVGGTYWRQAAKPVHNTKGELIGYMIGELQFAADSTFEAFFCNGGLIDFLGNPKGQWFHDFPPALPEVRVIATGRPDYVLVGEPQKLDVTVVNANPRPITDLKLGIRDRSGKWKGEISAEAIGDYTVASLAPGGVWRGSVKALVDQGSARRIRWALEVTYKYDGESHVSDDIIPTEIRDPLDVTPSAARIILDGTKAQTLTVKVRNNKRSEAALTPAAYAGTDFIAKPSAKRLDLASGAQTDFSIKITPAKPEAGLRNIALVDGSETKIPVITPLDCPKAAASLKIDGDLSDWPSEMVARGSVRFGKAIDQAERPATDPFPKPPPSKQSALEGKPKTAQQAGDKPAVYTYGANAALAWDDDALYMAIVVEDKTHVQRLTGLNVWREDSIQIGIDPLNNGDPAAKQPGGEMKAGFDPDDYELSLALTGEGPQVSLVTSPNGSQNGLVSDAELGVRHDGGFIVYEARVPWTVMRGIVPKRGEHFGLDILINNYEDGRRYTLGWAGGIAHGKYPGLFIPIFLK